MNFVPGKRAIDFGTLPASLVAIMQEYTDKYSKTVMISVADLFAMKKQEAESLPPCPACDARLTLGRFTIREHRSITASCGRAECDWSMTLDG